MKWSISIRKKVNGPWRRAWRKYRTRNEAREARWNKFGKYNHVRIVRVS